MDKALVKLYTQLKTTPHWKWGKSTTTKYPLAASPTSGFHTFEGDDDGRTNAKTLNFIYLFIYLFLH